uniref:MADF domain-containing protein n=1 Tax=Heterorhabditis bacteriophora TaxID=37862 RepID=A0A1I7X6D4_HETBA
MGNYSIKVEVEDKQIDDKGVWEKRETNKDRENIKRMVWSLNIFPSVWENGDGKRRSQLALWAKNEDVQKQKMARRKKASVVKAFRNETKPCDVYTRRGQELLRPRSLLLPVY